MFAVFDESKQVFDSIAVCLPIGNIKTDYRVGQLKRLAFQTLFAVEYIQHHVSVFIGSSKTELCRMSGIKLVIADVEPNVGLHHWAIISIREKNNLLFKVHVSALVVLSFQLQFIFTGRQILPFRQQGSYIRFKSSTDANQ